MEIDPALLLPPFSNPNLNLRPAETEQSTPILHPQHYLQYPVLLPAAVQPGTTHSQPPAGGTPTDEQEITPRLIRMEAKCCHLNQELEAAMEEYKTLVREISFDVATTLSPNHWGVLKSVKHQLRAEPESEQESRHPLNRHYFPEISLGPDLVAADFPALSNSWTRKAYERFKEQTNVGGIHGLPCQGQEWHPVDGETAQAIRVRATEIFYTIATHREDVVPLCWSLVDSNCKDFYRMKICEFWPDLRMSAFNWKADAIAGIVYPTWYWCFSSDLRKRQLLDQGEGQDGGRRKRQRRGPRTGPQETPPPPSSPQSSQSESQPPSSQSGSQPTSSHSPSLPLSQSSPPSTPIPPQSPIASPSQSFTKSPSPATGSSDILEPSPSQHNIPFIDNPFSDRRVSEIPTTVTARLLALNGPTGATAATVTTSTAPAKKKHANNTLSAKNLFLIEYYKTHDPVSANEFKQLWEDLGPAEQMAWQAKSRAARAAKKATDGSA